jgi:hypothetical protein
MKTILFSTDEKLIEEYQKQGDVIIAKDPIKTLRAMKDLGGKEEYKVVGDDKYVKVAKDLGYNKPKETPIQTVGKLTSFYEQQLKDQEEDFNNKILKLKEETENLKKIHQEKINELELKKNEIEDEKSKIKGVIKRIIYAD